MTQDERNQNTFYGWLGGGWDWRRFGGVGFGDFGGSTTKTGTYKVGTLVVNPFDTETKQLLWRGGLSRVVSRTSEKNIENPNKSVEKLSRNFHQGL